MVKMTFSLDDETVARIKRTAERHRKPQSWIVREAVADYAANADRLTPEEKHRMLAVLERIGTAPVEKASAEVDREIAGIRASRHAAGRRRPPR